MVTAGNNALKKLKDKLSSIFGNNSRSALIQKNILSSFFFKGGSFLIGLTLIPLTIDYINPVQYGVWITLSSIVNWFSFFDIGFGNGLRNKIAESAAFNKDSEIKVYISTTYFILAIISLVLFLLFAVVNHFVNWNSILNVPVSMINNLNALATLFFGCFCIQLVTQLINVVLTAFHNPSKVASNNFFMQLFCLVAVYILKLITKGALAKLIIILAGAPLLVQFIASLWYYSKDYKRFRPGIKDIRLSYAKSLLNSGGAFFIIQLGALVLLETDNIVIAQIFGPADVTVFNIVYRIFSTITLITTIVMTPFWSAFTDAYVKDDFDWIKQTLGKLYKYWLYICLVTLIMLGLSPFIYKVWIGSKIQVPFLLSFFMALQVVSLCWLMINCFFLNGIGKIKLQLYCYIFCMVINIPMSIYLSKQIGIIGVTVSNLIVFLYMDIILFIQCRKIVRKSATGIWAK